MRATPSWELFCRVVDNYGDIGVCWRLARQLAGEHGMAVRLWVDDLAALSRLWPAIDAKRDLQSCAGVEVRRWREPFVPAAPADIVVEAFACGLPESQLRAMAEREKRPLWVILEYLSAEAWVEGCHGRASPGPRLPLTGHFFFPGFTARSGGLLREQGLDMQRAAFQADAATQAAFWRELGLPAPERSECRVSLFCYPHSPAASLFACWSRQFRPVTCLVPEGIATAALTASFGSAVPQAGDVLVSGSLIVRVLPFLDQDRYDRLLWACDCNFVRGEDSFVRAQWAARPFVWQPYPQSEDAHLQKLEAFLYRYLGGLREEAAAAVTDLWLAWSRGDDPGAAWPAFHAQEEILRGHCDRWAAALSEQGDLAGNLLEFCRDRL